MKPWYRARTPLLLGQAIAGARESAELKQADLATAIRSSRPTISRIETGSAASSKTILEALEALDYEMVIVPRGSHLAIRPPEQD